MKKFHFLEKQTFYPALFRVLIGLVLLVDSIILFPNIEQIFNYQDFYYTGDKIFPFLKVIRDNIQVYYISFIFFLILFISGIGRNITSLIIFIFLVIKYLLLSGNTSYGTDILRMTLLFFIFINSFKYLAIHQHKTINLLSKLATLSIMLHICYIYLSNAILKILDDIWMSGDALFYFFLISKTPDIFNLSNIFLNYPLLLVLSSFGVILFQFLFPIFIWFQRTKYGVIVIGMIMHISMAFILQLYFFEIVVILHYGFFIKDEEWQKLLPFIKIKKVNG